MVFFTARTSDALHDNVSLDDHFNRRFSKFFTAFSENKLPKTIWESFYQPFATFCTANKVLFGVVSIAHILDAIFNVIERTVNFA